MATDSLFDVYTLGNGQVQRFLATANYSLQVSTTNPVIAVNLTNIVSNFQGQPPLTNQTKAYQVCNGQRQAVFTSLFSGYIVFADTRVKALSQTNQWYDNNNVPWGSWNVSWYCKAGTYPPDFDPINGVRDYLNPYPWGWDTYALCFSLTGHQPYNCGTGWPSSAQKFVSDPGLGTCSYHP